MSHSATPPTTPPSGTDDPSRGAPSTSKTPEPTKEELEKQKLTHEIRLLQKPFWKKETFWVSLSTPIVIGGLSLFGVWMSGWFNQERSKLRDEVAELKVQRDDLADSVETFTTETESLKRKTTDLESEKSQLEATNAALRKDKNDLLTSSSAGVAETAKLLEKTQAENRRLASASEMLATARLKVTAQQETLGRAQSLLNASVHPDGSFNSTVNMGFVVPRVRRDVNAALAVRWPWDSSDEQVPTSRP